MRALALAIALMTTVSLAAQDDPLAMARNLYATAAYEEALAELGRVGSAATTTTARDADAYRAFCLVALGRTAEAQAAAESLVRRDPTLSIDQFPDASPRIATMFAAVRRRVLPQLIKDEYRAARAKAAEHEDDAGARLRHVRDLLGVAEQIGAWDDTLADVRMLVDGFLDLRAAETPSTPAAPAATASADAGPPPDTATLTTAPTGASPAPSASFAAADSGVVAPTAVYQPQPSVPPMLLDLVRRLHRPSVIEVVINERGTVDEVIVRQSVSSAYDTLLVAAARTWRYRPAMKDGVPVRFVSTVAINAADR